MMRSIGGAVVGYLAMSLAVAFLLTTAYMMMGVDRAFQPGVYDVSALWMVLHLIIAVGAALLGGLVSRKVARRVLGPRILAGFILVVGIATVVPAITAEGGAETIAERSSEIGPLEAMQKAKTPLVALILNPIIGVVGVLVGGGALRGGQPAGSPQASAVPERSA